MGHHDAPRDQREERRKQREIRNQPGVDQDGDPRLQAAVHGHHTRDPVERAGEVDDAGGEAEQKGAAKGRARERRRAAASARSSRTPGDRTGETENEQRARHHGERDIRAAREQDTSSLAES